MRWLRSLLGGSLVGWLGVGALPVLVVVTAAEAGAAAPPAEGPVTLVFLATSDVHGHVEPERVRLALGRGREAEVERGGLTLLGGYLAIARQAYPGRVVLLDAGDMMQGTMVSNLGEGQAVVRAMNALGYAAAAVGNHEFDFGPLGPRDVARSADEDPRGALKARAGEARFPWLTANVVDGSGAPPAPLRRFALLQVAGIVIGVVGGTSEDTPRTTRIQNLEGLRVLPLAPAIAAAAAEARRAGATVVVAVVHEGGECHRLDAPDDPASCRADSEVFKLARALPAGTLDALFAGHTHQAVAARVAGVPVVQAWSEARGFSRIDLTIDRPSGRVVEGGAVIHPPTEVCSAVAGASSSCDPRRARGRALAPARYLGVEVRPDPAVVAAIAPDVARVAELAARPVGVTLGAPLTRSYRQESALGDLAADALRAGAAADVGLTNGGGLRADLPAGPLVEGALFRAFPFDNRLAVLHLPGAALRRLVGQNLAGDRGILSVSGIEVTAGCQGAELRLSIADAEGRPLDDARVYRVATSDFLAHGGDDFGALGPLLLPSGPETGPEPPLMRELVARELRRRGPRLAGDREVLDPARPRLRLARPRPLRCPDPIPAGPR